jgi:hypothetical protein
MRRGRKRRGGCEFDTRKQRERFGAKSLARHIATRDEGIKERVMGTRETLARGIRERRKKHPRHARVMPRRDKSMLYL